MFAASASIPSIPSSRAQPVAQHLLARVVAGTRPIHHLHAVEFLAPPRTSPSTPNHRAWVVEIDHSPAVSFAPNLTRGLFRLRYRLHHRPRPGSLAGVGAGHIDRT